MDDISQNETPIERAKIGKAAREAQNSNDISRKLNTNSGVRNNTLSIEKVQQYYNRAKISELEWHWIRTVRSIILI